MKALKVVKLPTVKCSQQISNSKDIEKAKNLGTYTLLYSKINLNTRQKNKAKTEQDLEVISSFLNSPFFDLI